MDTTQSDKQAAPEGNDGSTGERGDGRPERDDGQEYLDRSKLDFDPDDGLLSGTAVDGTSEIPGPHENADTSIEAQTREMTDGVETDGVETDGVETDGVETDGVETGGDKAGGDEAASDE